MIGGQARRAAWIAALAAAVPATFIAIALHSGEAYSHGTMSTPVSRVYNCYLEGPESPDTPPCRDAVTIGGTQPLYDWNEINLANANGQSRSIIPDGQLCSAGRAKYAGFDQARADWVATTMPTSGPYTFKFRATAPHRGTFELYLTKQGYNPTVPLRWSDLDATPFLRVTDPVVADGYYTLSGNLPGGRTGRHLIYVVWQRSDSTEAFYSCSDVIFGSAPSQSPVPPSPSASTTPASPSPSTVPPSPSRTAAPSSAPPGQYPAWAPNVFYAVGTRVSYGGRNYECRQAHTSLVGWEPPNVLALWLPL